MSEREKVYIEEIVFSNILSIEALMNLLTHKGLITQEKTLDELKSI